MMCYSEFTSEQARTVHWTPRTFHRLSPMNRPSKSSVWRQYGDLVLRFTVSWHEQPQRLSYWYSDATEWSHTDQTHLQVHSAATFCLQQTTLYFVLRSYWRW
jgi:hypothetical protein